MLEKLWDRVREVRGRDAGRGQPVWSRTATGARSSRWTVRCRSTTTRTFRHAGVRRLSRTLHRDRPARAARAGGRTSTTSSSHGSVGIIGNGAGLVMSTLDVVAYAGEEFGGVRSLRTSSTLGGGASAEVMADGLEIILSDAEVKAVFVNVFGGITACDAVANGIVQALADPLESKGEAVSKKLVVRLDGNNADLGRQILARRGRTRSWRSSTRWTEPRDAWPSSPRRTREPESTHGDLPHRGLQGSSSRASPALRARKHTKSHARVSRNQHRRRRHRRQGWSDGRGRGSR